MKPTATFHPFLCNANMVLVWNSTAGVYEFARYYQTQPVNASGANHQSIGFSLKTRLGEDPTNGARDC